MQSNPMGKKRGGWGQESYENSYLSFLAKKYKIVAQNQVETLVFLIFYSCFSWLAECAYTSILSTCLQNDTNNTSLTETH